MLKMIEVWKKMVRIWVAAEFGREQPGGGHICVQARETVSRNATTG